MQSPAASVESAGGYRSCLWRPRDIRRPVFGTGSRRWQGFRPTWPAPRTLPRRQRRLCSWRWSYPGRSVSAGEIDRLFAAGINRSTDSGLGAYCGHPLTAGGKVIGMIGVAGGNVYSVIQRRALGILANQVAAAVETFGLQQRRQELVDALVNLRADLDRSEKQRVLNEERAHSALRIERAHELAVQALLAVSTHARTGASFSAFYRGLTESVAELVGAGKVLFWQLNENRTLTPIAGSYGIDDEFIARLYPAPAEPFGSDLASQVAYNDFVF